MESRKSRKLCFQPLPNKWHVMRTIYDLAEIEEIDIYDSFRCKYTCLYRGVFKNVSFR